ncbi:hypothetical protein K3172_14165 [Qipengyuania sp. 6B39]|uniref:MarR family winged helix-turn-helix transcriptional regulator n=1 Tax=Qipengyuania proteolytica TaxID=2867239 RepID=UPI001C8AD188|nr:hypothetical protein [Qipengyuania proteolytica]MBX7497003.1 hypothetical protein [Qipengyuania proteolytica]
MNHSESDDLRSIAQRLLALAGPRAASECEGPASNAPEHLAIARREIARRAARNRVMPVELLGEPVWDMLVDLLVNELEGKEIGVTSLCQASGAPMSTALRYVDLLAAEGLISRRPDPADGRRSLVSLTSRASKLLLQALEAMARAERKSADASTPSPRGDS